MPCMKPPKPSKSIANWTNALLIPLMAIGLSACGDAAGGQAFPPAIVEIQPVVQDVWKLTYTASGAIEARNKVDLNAEVPGVINLIGFKEGERVSKGELLIRLKADKYRAQVGESYAGIRASQSDVRSQQAEIDRLEAQADAARSRLKLAEDEYNRFKALLDGQFISVQELDEKRVAFDTARAEYRAAVNALDNAKALKTQALANVQRAKSTYLYTQAQAEEARIVAPFSGAVGQKYVDLGDYVAPTEKLLTLVDNSVMRIGFPVPERHLGYMREGLPVIVQVEGFRDEVFSGRVSFVDPVVDAGSRTVMVKAVVDDPKGLLRHGQSGRVRLILDDVPDSLVIPEEAIVLQGEKTLVWVVEDGKAVSREVTVGQRDAGRAQIMAGLEPGDQVVTSGLQKIHFDGQPVQKAGAQPGPQQAAGQSQPAQSAKSSQG